MKDHCQRTIDYLRISLTDRCNLRCIYCMPEEGVPALCHAEILRIEEFAEVVRIAAQMGIKHIRLTGGEPLVRKGVVDLVRQCVETPGVESVALTTNGTLLARMAPALAEAGLSRVNISLDTLDPEQYRAITRRGELADALAGIETAFEYGLEPVKINVVAVRSLNQDFLSFAKMTFDRPLHLRFIEYMPVGHSAGPNGCGWGPDDVIPSRELRETLSAQCEQAGLGALVPANDDAPEGWGPAAYWRLHGAQGTLGFISSVSDHFCARCNRLRLTADGRIRPCLFSDTEYDIRSALRSQDEDAVRRVLEEALANKPENHANRVGTTRMMSQVGG
jgi:cyclic pyranopterin phosphate synthase